MTLPVVHFKSPARCRCTWFRVWFTESTVIGKSSGSVSNRNLWIPNRSECSSSSLGPSPATERQMYFQSQARRRMINSGSRGNRSAIGSNSFAKSSSELSKLKYLGRITSAFTGPRRNTCKQKNPRDPRLRVRRIVFQRFDVHVHSGQELMTFN